MERLIGRKVYAPGEKVSRADHYAQNAGDATKELIHAAGYRDTGIPSSYDRLGPFAVVKAHGQIDGDMEVLDEDYCLSSHPSMRHELFDHWKLYYRKADKSYMLVTEPYVSNSPSLLHLVSTMHEWCFLRGVSCRFALFTAMHNPGGCVHIQIHGNGVPLFLD